MLTSEFKICSGGAFKRIFKERFWLFIPFKHGCYVRYKFKTVTVRFKIACCEQMRWYFSIVIHIPQVYLCSVQNIVFIWSPGCLSKCKNSPRNQWLSHTGRHKIFPILLLWGTSHLDTFTIILWSFCVLVSVHCYVTFIVIV